MSNLEDKALTRAQLNCYPYLPFPDTKAFLEAEKWVPLVDAQKREADLLYQLTSYQKSLEQKTLDWEKREYDLLTELEQAKKGFVESEKNVEKLGWENAEYVAMIEAANKIITEYNEWFHKQCWQPWIIASHWKETFEQLNALYIPRKEEGEK
jgi:tRNA A37 methylthiotransferase MiaB